MKFRFHRGGLVEAMETLVEIKDGNHLLAHIVQNGWFTQGPIGIDSDACGPDDRIGWKNTYYVCDKQGVIGMIDTMIEELSDAHKR